MDRLVDEDFAPKLPPLLVQMSYASRREPRFRKVEAGLFYFKTLRPIDAAIGLSRPTFRLSGAALL